MGLDDNGKLCATFNMMLGVPVIPSQCGDVVPQRPQTQGGCWVLSCCWSCCQVYSWVNVGSAVATQVRKALLLRTKSGFLSIKDSGPLFSLDSVSPFISGGASEACFSWFWLLVLGAAPLQSHLLWAAGVPHFLLQSSLCTQRVMAEGTSLHLRINGFIDSLAWSWP